MKTLYNTSFWKKSKLAKCCKIISGATPSRSKPEFWGGNILWVTPKDLSNLKESILYNTPEKITEDGLKNCSANLLPEGAILFSSRAPIGHVAIVGKSMCTNQGFKSLIPGPDVDSKYLYWTMKHVTPTIKSMGRGATFKEVSKEIMESVEIPLPPLPEQRRIAAILDKADALRRKRADTLKLLDDFLRSVFLDMFGDPVRNEKRWKTQPIGELGNVITGATPSSNKNGMFGGKIPFITPGDLESGKLPERYLTQNGANNSRMVRKGSTLVCCIGATVGKTDIALTPIAFNQQINAIEWGSKVIDEYGFSALNYGRASVINGAIKTTLPIIKKSLFSKIRIPVPPIDEQKKFSAIFRKQREYLSKLAIGANKISELSNSLTQRAFRGEL